jgi:hypothetical protein
LFDLAYLMWRLMVRPLIIISRMEAAWFLLLCCLFAGSSPQELSVSWCGGLLKQQGPGFVVIVLLSCLCWIWVLFVVCVLLVESQIPCSLLRRCSGCYLSCFSRLALCGKAGIPSRSCWRIHVQTEALKRGLWIFWMYYYWGMLVVSLLVFFSHAIGWVSFLFMLPYQEHVA